MSQYGFFIDLSRCIGCNACVIACKQWRDLPPGPIKWLRVYQWETGSFPDINLHVLPIMCLHCEKPACIKACPHGAVRKETKYGAVLADPGKCTGERQCWKACPYGAPQFEGDGPGRRMSKCDMCIDRLEKGNKPICVLSCSLRALEFGPIDELREKYGDPPQLDFLPRGSITRPSAIFKPIDRKKQIIPWDWKKAFELWQKRHPDGDSALPDVFEDMSDIPQVRGDIIGRNRLVLKPRNSEELMFYTTDDE
jgi:anaerobic dimethyl sulfoxide reductase subunit B (iron-sulfur subunit)